MLRNFGQRCLGLPIALARIECIRGPRTALRSGRKPGPGLVIRFSNSYTTCGQSQRGSFLLLKFPHPPTPMVPRISSNLTGISVSRAIMPSIVGKPLISRIYFENVSMETLKSGDIFMLRRFHLFSARYLMIGSGGVMFFPKRASRS